MTINSKLDGHQKRYVFPKTDPRTDPRQNENAPNTLCIWDSEHFVCTSGGK